MRGIWSALFLVACTPELPRGEPRELPAPVAREIRSGMPAPREASLRAIRNAWRDGWGTRNPRVAIVDFMRASTDRRLQVFDLESGQRLYRERVARGSGRGFSNVEGSHASSLGVFVTGAPYHGRHGRSLRLHGLEPGINDAALRRAIVLHGANYVTDAYVRRRGRVGHSHGCFAVRPEVAGPLVDTLADGALLIAFGDDVDWRTSSRFLME